MTISRPDMRQRLISALRDLAAVELERPESYAGDLWRWIEECDVDLDSFDLFDFRSRDGIGIYFFDIEETNEVDLFIKLYNEIGDRACEIDQIDWQEHFAHDPEFQQLRKEATSLADSMDMRERNQKG